MLTSKLRVLHCMDLPFWGGRLDGEVDEVTSLLSTIFRVLVPKVGHLSQFRDHVSTSHPRT